MICTKCALAVASVQEHPRHLKLPSGYIMLKVQARCVEIAGKLFIPYRRRSTMSLVKTNDLKKGTRVKLANGWYATLADNARGNTRMATVEGRVTETGSVYAHDIMEAQVANSWVTVNHTPQQQQMRQAVKTWGF
jgi:nitrogen fixation protein